MMIEITPPLWLRSGPDRLLVVLTLFMDVLPVALARLPIASQIRRNCFCKYAQINFATYVPEKNSEYRKCEDLILQVKINLFTVE